MSAAFSTSTEVGMLDARTSLGSVTLPLTTDIPSRMITLKDVFGTAANSTITIKTQGSDLFEDGTTSKTMAANYDFMTLHAGSTNRWYIHATSLPPTMTMGSTITRFLSASNATISSINGAVPLLPANIASTIAGLGTAGFISTSQLTSSITASAFTGAINSISTGTLTTGSLTLTNQTLTLTNGTVAGVSTLSGGTFTTAYNVTNFVGNGTTGSTDGTGTNAPIYYAWGLSPVDNNGTFYAVDGNNKIRKITAAGVITTVAGSGTPASTDGTGTNASFNTPTGITFDTNGNLYVVDFFGHKIRMITPAGVVTTLAGTGSPAFANGTGTNASFNYPWGIVTDNLGNLYISDRDNGRIRKLVIATGVVTTLAGNGSGTSTDGTGTNAIVSYPTGLTIDPATGTMIVADGSRIRRVTFAGVVTTIAGNTTTASIDGVGTNASFNGPLGLAVDLEGNIFVGEQVGYRVRKITPAGVVTTIAGSGTATTVNGIGASASFNQVLGATIDRFGNIYAFDLGHYIRKLIPIPSNPFTSYTGSLNVSTIYANTGINSMRLGADYGVVTTFAGSGSGAVTNGTGTAASFSNPEGVVYDPVSNCLYASERGGGTIRKITLAGVVTTLASGFSALRNGITVDPAGNVYVVQGANTNIINKITAAGVATVFAGSGATASTDGTGTNAAFNNPYGITCDPTGNYLYVSDASTNKIRRVTLAGAVVTTIAGTGGGGSVDGAALTTATFNTPSGLAVDQAGNLYINDGGSNKIRKLSLAGIVTTVAGSGSSGGVDGVGTNATFSDTRGIVVDPVTNNLYVADATGAIVRKITPAGVVTTIAGQAGVNSTVNGLGSDARLNYPTDIAIDPAGNLYTTDTVGNTIRKITLATTLTNVIISTNAIITAPAVSTLALNISSINGQTPIGLSTMISTVAGLNSNISSMIDSTELTSTIAGLGTAGFISTATLTSTVIGLTTATSTVAANAFTGSINAISTGTLTASTISTLATFSGTVKANSISTTTIVATSTTTSNLALIDTITQLLGIIQQQNSILYFNSFPIGGTLAWYGQVIVPPGPPLILTYYYTGANQTWTVPNGLTSINVYMWAAGGGGSTTAAGGAGAFVQAAVPVTPGETLTFIVGGGGGNASGSSAYGGGGIGGTSANSRGGGGRTAILRGSIGSADFVTVGAGGGASVFAGNTNGAGAGGILTGSAATGTNGLEGLGGSQSVGGSGTSGNLTAGTSGSQYVGGNAGSNGGGGGAGYYGGGGSGTSTALGASGGGGSSLVNNILPIVLAVSANGYSAPNTSSAYYSAGVGAGCITSGGSGGNGLIVVSYTAGPPTTPTGLTLTLNGSTATMSWSNTSAALYYWAFYGGSSNAYSGTYLTSGSTTGTSVSYSISMTFFDYFYVVGLSPLGCISPIASSPIIQVPMPSNLSLIANGTSVVMSWSAVSGATSYTYGLYSNSSYAYTGSSVATGSVGTTTASYSSGVVGTYYYFTVLATTSTGTSLTAISGIIQDVPALSFTYSGTVSSNISTGVTYYSFLTSGNLVTPTTQNINYLLIGGGGGGGGGIGGGGGGAGADVIGTYSLSAGTYSVTIGAGGAGLPGSSGTQGPGSVGLSTIINGTTLGVPGGGAGGGGSASTGAGGAIATSTTGGGGGGSYTSGNSAAGGGGGVGSAGLNGGGAGGPNSGGGNGGTGITYAGFQLGGGGAGSGWVGGNVGGGTATYGGGNGGTNNAVTNAGCNAIANTGAGGGGGTYGGGVNSYGGGGNGGTGIVILSYPPVTPSPTNLALTPAVGNTATLSWTPAAGATGYSWIVYQSATNSYNGTSFSTGTTNSTTYTATVSGLNSTSYYYFTVIATGTVNSAAAVSAIMYELSDPPTPTITTTGTTVNMSWTAISGALYYTYTVFQASGYAYSGTQVATANNGTVLTSSYTGIAGNYYYFTITVTTSAGTSAAAMSGIAQAVATLTISASGGIQTTPTGYSVFTFTTVGTTTFTLTSPSTASYQSLIVSGGGGGWGPYIGAGGGAGGAVITSSSLTSGSYNVIVGAGGIQGGYNGGSSSFNGVSVVGGGGGGRDGGGSGACGGGGTPGGTGSLGQNGGADLPSQLGGGGGGGMGAGPGAAGTTNGNGGAGATYSVGGGSYLVCGGGGGARTDIRTSGGIGGGGGGGSRSGGGGNGTDGTPNTGGGGGGNDAGSLAGNGGSGIVVLAFMTAQFPPTNPILVTSGGSATMSWTAATGATGYNWNLYQSSSNAYTGASFATGTTTSATTATTTGLSLNYYYYFTVAATGVAISPAVASAIILQLITGPATATLTSIGNTMSMSWSAVSGATNYAYSLYTGAANSYAGMAFVTSGSTASTSATYTTGVANNYYYFTVTATTASGTSAPLSSGITQCWLPSSSSTPLITWLNGSTLTSSSTNWANSGTNGGTATFSNAYSMVQVNGIYAVSFSTASGYVSFPVTSSAANRTVLVVLKFGASLTTSAGAYANILSCTAWGCELVYSSGTSYYYNWDYAGVAAWGYSSMFNANQTSLPAVFGGIIVGATGLTTSFYNGVAPTSTPQQTANVPTGTNVTGTVPGQYRTGVNPPCTVCEVIMYDGALSAGDAALCLAYLRAKWATG